MLVLAIESWLAVAPAICCQLAPWSVETSHCTVGAGKPDAVASKAALWPSSTVTPTGCLVTAGSFWTVSVAASLVAVPAVFLNVARYSWPLLEVLTLASVSLFDVAPATFVQFLPAFTDVSHCTVGAGKSEAAASKAALWPSSTVMLAGWVVTAGDLRTVRVPALVESSQLTVGVGTPEAALLKLTLWPSSTVTLAGCVVTFGAFSLPAARIGAWPAPAVGGPPLMRAEAVALRALAASSTIARSERLRARRARAAAGAVASRSAPLRSRPLPARVCSVILAIPIPLVLVPVELAPCPAPRRGRLPQPATMCRRRTHLGARTAEPTCVGP